MALRGIRFCKDCANILYAKELTDQETNNKHLIYSCRICDYTEKATKAEDCLVYYRQVRRLAEHVATDYKDFPLDPTLSRTKDVACPRCNFSEAVFFHSENETGESAMRLTFVCANRVGEKACGFSWQS
jgi:DNA-directed RNA polymerase II subunit RPB9